MSANLTRLVPIEDFPKDSSKPVEVDGKKLLVCHSADAFFVVVNKCSHADEALDCGRVRRGWISCPIHGVRFDLATGEAKNPPAVVPIKTYPAQVIDGWVAADLSA